jgi:peptidoglycan hydrolase-like protein with peptidoglycan-binding domain
LPWVLPMTPVFRAILAAMIVLIVTASTGAARGLAQEAKPNIDTLLPAIMKSLGKNGSTLMDRLKKAAEGTSKNTGSTFNAPAFPASPGATGTASPASPTSPRIAKSKAGAIQAAQGHLNRLGYNAGPVDGRMRPRTRKAIRSFQASRGLQSTGRVSAALLKELGRSTERARAEKVGASASSLGTKEPGPAPADCVIPKAFRDTLKGVRPIGASSRGRIKAGRYRVTGRQALGTPGRKHYVRSGEVVDVQFGAKKAGWRIGGPIICQDGVAIGVAYRGRGFFAGNGKKRIFVPLAKDES